MPFHSTVLISLLLCASLGATLSIIRGCEADIHALRRQSEEIRHGIAGLREALGG